ncbi:hypothetical protein RJ639_030678 [Escallonia herrerae]|uniref:Transcription termination factor MTERF15, mitochondrial n=1 Tax=Escallonia herrerae TaxID=1293975 RepID=A0AA88X703_9ASTE|nr:hypothetical protein RJ639_030678 [Escallonia herrerae]
MAVRVLTRPTLHRFIALTSKPIIPLSNLKHKHFSSNPIYPISTTPEFSQKLNLFQRYGFPPSHLHNFLTQNRFLLDSNPSGIEKSLEILESLNSCQKFLVSTVLDCPEVLKPEFLKMWQVGISEMGLSDPTPLMIRSVFELSTKFNVDPDDLSACLRRLKGLGFSDVTVTRVLEAYPMVIMMSEERIREKMEFLVGIGIKIYEINWLFGRFPGILVIGVDNKLKPLFAEIRCLGIGVNEVRREILRDPRVLELEVGELSQTLRMLRSLKCCALIKDKIFRQGTLRAGYEVKLRIDCLRKHGFIYRDALTVLWKEPRAVLYDVEDIQKKVDFLVTKMKVDVSWLVEVPEYLGVNFEKQIVPRYRVIEYLRSKGWLGDEVWLMSLIKPSRLRFYNLYVKPYPECEKLYGRFAGTVEVKNQHPAGLWKLFKPQNYPESNEDVKNIKSFMEALV